MALYGAPVWLDALDKGENLFRLKASQKIIATRVARGYRTISYEAACVLAGSTPWDLVAETYSIMHQWRTDLRGRGVRPEPEAIRDLRSHLHDQELDLWQVRLENPTAGHRVVEAIQFFMIE